MTGLQRKRLKFELVGLQLSRHSVKKLGCRWGEDFAIEACLCEGHYSRAFSDICKPKVTVLTICRAYADFELKVEQRPRHQSIMELAGRSDVAGDL